jgi:hypothetical protein
MHRKTAPKVDGGRALRKNNWAPTTDAVMLAGTAVAFERRRPGPGFKHLLRKADLERFVALLPDWDELASGLHLVILDSGDGESDGWHSPGTIAIRAWERELWIDHAWQHVEAHRALLERLGVAVQRPRDGYATVEWTEASARAYQLLHIFLHELGHHHDRMTTRARRATARGEWYAESYANRYADRIWRDYQATFGW